MKTRELKTAEKFYVQQHMGTKTLAELAADLETSETTVKMFIDTLPKQEVTSVVMDGNTAKEMKSGSAQDLVNNTAEATNVKSKEPNASGSMVMTEDMARKNNRVDIYGNPRDVAGSLVKNIFDDDVVPLERK